MDKVTRLEIPAYTDRWMMGDRFGDLVTVGRRNGKQIAVVKLDKSGKIARYLLDDCSVVG
jgi:hypothetical protein